MKLLRPLDLLWVDGVHTDEDYLAVLRRKCLGLWGLLVMGVVALAVAALAFGLDWNIAANDHTLAYYCGIGCGLIGGAAVSIIRLHRTMKDPQKLRTGRIRYSDERLREISRRAWMTAGGVLFTVLYLLGLVGGLFYPILRQASVILIGIFAVTYLVTKLVLNKSM